MLASLASPTLPARVSRETSHPSIQSVILNAHPYTRHDTHLTHPFGNWGVHDLDTYPPPWETVVFFVYFLAYLARHAETPAYTAAYTHLADRHFRRLGGKGRIFHGLNLRGLPSLLREEVGF